MLRSLHAFKSEQTLEALDIFRAAGDFGRMAHQHLVVEQATASPPVLKARTGSCIGTGMSIIGNIECNGAAQVFGRIEGELRASDLLLGNGAQVEGSVIAQEVTVCDRVKGTVRIKLQNGGVVEGDFYQSLSIDENSQFEGSSRRVENPTEPSSSVDAKGPRKQDMQSLSPTPSRSIDADLQQVERWLRSPVLK
jgi:cytoskeletal protein CcmA (bactofilin family)